jgi:hypothetical protein
MTQAVQDPIEKLVIYFQHCADSPFPQVFISSVGALVVSFKFFRATI